MYLRGIFNSLSVKLVDLRELEHGNQSLSQSFVNIIPISLYEKRISSREYLKSLNSISQVWVYILWNSLGMCVMNTEEVSQGCQIYLTLSCLPIYPMPSLKVFYQNMDYYNELNIYQTVLNEFQPNFAETW